MFVPLRVTTKPHVHGSHMGWVIEENGCHTWQGSIGTHGYGLLTLNGKTDTVHRWRYLREKGPIPDGLHLDHFACDNRKCCNPDHVRPVTQRENILRGNSISSHHASRTHCPKGHQLGGDNAMPWRNKVENNRLCKTCYNEKRKGWRRARLARGLPR